MAFPVHGRKNLKIAMPALQLYNTLLQLPLFQGLSEAELSDIVDKTRFGFHKATKGDILAEEGKTCDRLCFMLNGSLKITSHAHDHSYTITEEMPSPTVIQPERMFGLSPRYTKTFSATCTCNFLTLDKSEVMALTENFMIFRFNLMNIISAVAQKRSSILWRSTPHDVRDRIARFIELRCAYPAGEKHIKIRMEDLAREISDSRLNVSRALNAMQKEGVITLSRGMIHIPHAETVISICNIR